VLGFGVDISEQVRVEGRLRNLTRQSDSILESIGEGIYGIDLEGKVTVVNSAAAQMLGYKQEEILGRNMHELIRHTRADGTPYAEESSPIRKSLVNFDTVRVSDEIFWRKDGTSFPVEYVARPQIDTHSLESGGMKTVGVVVAFTDTTERRALDRMKDEFISTVSHELRTPLTSLRGALGLLAGGALSARPEKTQQMLDIAIGNTDRLVRLVNDILDLERISSGKTELHSTMCSAEDLLRRAASVQQAHAPKPNIRIFFAANGVSVWADPDRILQTLNNLISNAIKFSPPGSEIHLTARTLDDNEALIEVRDQGHGIPADKLEHIFERFQQGDASDSRALGGTGLGLAICRSIITQHGGRIWATSTPDQGTTFHFTLPTKPSNNLR
jgi:two-component system, OmpR family, sensor histidine kinase VicK